MAKTADALARTALAFIDMHGVDALTIRALGQEVDMHHTAVYRHYRSKNELLRAVLAIVISDAFTQTGPLPQDPKERLIALISGVRSALNAHPAVTVAYLLPDETLGNSGPASEVQALVIQALRDLGLRGSDLLIRYQMLESYTLGASVFDFGGAPDHLTSRRRRREMLADPDLRDLTHGNAGVQDFNEEAFHIGVQTLVDECVAAGRAAGVGAGAAHG